MSDFTAVMVVIAVIQLSKKLQLKALMKELRTADYNCRNTGAL